MADRQNRRRLLSALLAVLCLSTATVAAATFEHGTECRTVNEGEPILRIRWPRFASPPATHIDVSFYKDGLSTGRFVSAAVTDPRTFPSSGVAMVATERPMAALVELLALSPRLESLRLVNEDREVEAVLGELIPGLNYYVRMRGMDGEDIRVQAPICPRD